MPASLTATKRLEWLQSQRERAVTEVESLTERAVDADRDLTDEEQASCSRRRTDVERLDREIETEVAACERSAQYEQLAGRIEPAIRSRSVGVLTAGAPAEPEMVYRSPGAYLVDYFRSTREQDPAATERLQTFRSTLQRANVTTAQVLGVVPEPVVAPVISDIQARRPAIEAATRRPMPAGGRTFTRPRIAQHVQVGKQTAEKTAVPSRALLVDDLTVTKITFGGSVNLSWQARDWSDPAILDIIVSDLAAEYARETDADFCATLVAGATQSVDAATGATPTTSASSWLAAIYEAAALVFAAGNATPNVLWAAPDVWADLGSMVDGAGRPMFGTLSPANVMGAINAGNQGGNVAGFNLAVDANLPAGTAILGDSGAVEFYEQVGGTVSALEPSLLGTDIAYFGYAASVVVRPNALVSIES
jgi:HK97 family phage major capsid protein